MSACSMRFCTNRSSRNPGLKFFRYPKDEEILDKWLLYSRNRINLRNARVCSIHFDSSAFRKNSEGLRRPLRPDAAPTLFVADIDEPLDDKPSTTKTSTNAQDSQPNTDSTFENQKTYVLAKLGTVIQSTEYCSLCLSTDDLCRFDLPTINCDLNEMLFEVFGKKIPSFLSSDWICKECKTNTINTYNFLQRTKISSTILNELIDDLNDKVEEMNGIEFENIENVVLTPTLRHERDKIETVIAEDLIQDDNEEIEEQYQLTYDLDIENENEEVENEFISDHCEFKGKTKNIVENHMRSHSNRCPDCNLRLRKDRPHKRCKFGCTDCDKRPCVHEEYLKSFFKQKHAGRTIVKCPACRYSVVKKCDLIEHVNRDHINSFKHLCDICSQAFYSKRSLTNHKYLFHTECFTCGYCDFDFRNKNVLATHIMQCEKEIRAFGCDKCSATFDGKDKVTAHIKKRHDLTYFCEECLFKCNSLKTLKIHRQATHSGQVLSRRKNALSCSVCHKIFSEHRDFRLHMRKHPKSVKHVSRCCGRKFKTRAKCIIHENNHHFRYEKCTLCFKYVKESKYDDHVKSHDVNHLCESCGKNFNSEINLKIHMKTHDELRIQCNICNKMLKNSSLKAHLLRHQAENDPDLDFHLKQRKRHSCENCDYSTPNVKYLEAHVNRHHLKIKPYKCNLCSKEFTAEFLLQIHKVSHEKQKVFHCETCGKSFGARLGLQLHIRREHSGQKPYQCDVCNQCFISSSILSSHKRTTHMGKTVPCPLCQTLFHDYARVRMHIKRVHWKGGNKFDLREIEGITEEHLMLLEDRRKSLYFTKDDVVM